MYQNMGYLSEALSARATELADDSAAHGQKRLTGHPACQLSPSQECESCRGEYRVHSSTHLTRPSLDLGESGFKFAGDIHDTKQELQIACTPVQRRAILYFERKKKIIKIQC